MMGKLKCENCGSHVLIADRVSIMGMYEMHLFHRYKGSTVDEVINNWLEHISKPIPAIVGGRKVDDMGATMLCPATVLSGDKELRRVGMMVHPNTKTREPTKKDIDTYRMELLADPDISRLLAEGAYDRT